MKLTVLLLTLLVSFLGHARKPAVEDFVGVEPESYKPVPKGAEVLFDFGNKVKANQNKAAVNYDHQKNNQTSMIALSLFLLLPSLMWFALTRTQQLQKIEKSFQENQIPDNVTHLDEFKGTSDDSDKKAS